MLFASAFDTLILPAGGAGIATLLIIVAYRLITDRTAVMSELASLTDQVVNLDRKVKDLEKLYDEQRGLKHQAYNDVARTTTALELVRRLAKECTCGVLEPLNSIIDRILDDMETRRRHVVGANGETT